MCLMEQQEITFSVAFCLSLWCFSSAIFSWFWLVCMPWPWIMEKQFQGFLIHFFIKTNHSHHLYTISLSWKLQMNLLKKHFSLCFACNLSNLRGFSSIVPSILFRRIQILWLFHSNLSDWCSSKVPTQLLWPLKQPASLLILYFFLFSSNHKIREWIYSRLYVCRRFSNDFLLIYIRNV